MMLAKIYCCIRITKNLIVLSLKMHGVRKINYGDERKNYSVFTAIFKEWKATQIKYIQGASSNGTFQTRNEIESN